MKLAPGAGWDGRSSASASARDLQSHRRVRGVREGNKRWDCILSTSVGEVYLCKCNWYYMVLKCNPIEDIIVVELFQLLCQSNVTNYFGLHFDNFSDYFLNKWVFNFQQHLQQHRCQMTGVKLRFNMDILEVDSVIHCSHWTIIFAAIFWYLCKKKQMFTLLALEHISNRRCCCCNVEKAQANTPERDKSTGRGRCHSDTGQGNQSEASE